MKTFEQARKFIEDASKTGSVLGLLSISLLMETLGNVQEELNFIHIAGTNGKGSVGTYLESVLTEAGYSVARYTSPAVFNPLEIYKCSGKYIEKDEYVKVMSQVKNACDIMVSENKPMPTVFEIETAAAFLWFYQKKPDIVLLEVGMGGETDATNVISKSMASVLTSISFDHMQFLGDSLSDIARIKAGIIKENGIVFSAGQSDEVKAEIDYIVKEKNAKIIYADESKATTIQTGIDGLRFDYLLSDSSDKTYEISSSMSGIYQVKNILLAIEVVTNLFVDISFETIQKGIKSAYWPGRFEKISNNPLVIIDGAHNEAAANELARTVENCFTNQRLTYIIGVLEDKEHEKMLKVMLPYADSVYTITSDNSRAMAAEKLAGEAMNYHDRVICCDSISEAYEKAVLDKRPILAFGSLSYLEALKECVVVESRK